MAPGLCRKASTSYFDNRFERQVVKLMPGDYYIGKQHELLVTVLGSCVSLCLFDPVLKISGMNHYMLPGCPKDDEPILTRYGWPAMTCLLREMLSAGAVKSRLVAKIFGGAQGFHQEVSTLRVGEKNIACARQFLEEHHMACRAENVGGHDARRLNFSSDTGQVNLLRMPHTHRRSALIK